MNKEEEKNLKEEFAEYLRHNWENRETLPVADWWLNKMKEQLEQFTVDTILAIIKNKE